MSVTKQQFSDDIAEQRERWYREGHFSTRTIGEQLAVAAEKFPGQGYVFATEAERISMTFVEALEQSRCVAGGLQALGLRPGDTVAIQVSNRPELVTSYFGAYLAGLTIVPITHIYGPREVSFILRESGAKALILPDRWRSIDYLERVARLKDVSALEHVIMLGEGSTETSIRWDDMITSGQYREVEISADDVCTIIYTSGTTSNPKGVQHTHNSLLAEMATIGPMLECGPGENKLVPWPAGHIAGLIGVCGGLIGGPGVVLMDRWDAVAAVQLIEEFSCVGTSGTPLHVAAILEAAASTGADISSLRYIQVGGANVPPELVDRAERAGISVGRAYGSTEHPTSASSSPQADRWTRSRTDGHVRFSHELKIVDLSGEDVAIGEEGEIVTRGPMQFVGYHDESLNLESFLPGGWFRTGDIGRLDDRGRLTVTDRLKDIIIRGGENIASKEVEDLMATHPRVLEAAVVAEPDPKYGERVAAFVLLGEGDSLDVEEIRSMFAEAGIAPQKAPERIEVVTDLPRTPSGKVQKFALRERLSTP
ncbi:class I adenylate-forming enzyme family protein [Aeromicrobium yanjiei]|uniref:AMP-binding protein n=1 Tax=Aeromicrobium yanjiei TaxID=2662028 RepID=A0A5Q2MIS5_9ACTN|nr:AMP-binding protein [Aeromicrobium yanjiei]QGG41593.1 AMP-binding protein [Aeromicrobium yanjiei]